MKNIERYQHIECVQALRDFPVVALVGPRQVGKSTLARRILAEHKGPSTFLDLERPSDLAMLDQAEYFLQNKIDTLICIDEIQRKPELFPLLRSLIDQFDRKPRFLVLGSASPELLQQSSESLAGRIRYLELYPFNVSEVGINKIEQLWSRGGYPLSFLAAEDKQSFIWREEFIRSFVERDLPQLGFRRSALLTRRLWTMLAHLHGQLLNQSKLAQSLELSTPSIKGYVEMLSDCFMLRILQPYSTNTKKRLVKSPKVYIRDSGLLHSLLGLETFDNLFSHPNYGTSWEGFVIENILSILPSSFQAFFYRTDRGAEIDLLLVKGRERIAIECKASLSPKLSRENYQALKDLQPTRTFVVSLVKKEVEIEKGIVNCSLEHVLASLA